MNMENNCYSVYKHTSPNGKIYIGITAIDPEKRWKQGYSHNRHFSMAIKKYGWENISSEIIASNLTQKDACEMEISLIKEYNSTNRNYGYNISTGGESGRLGVKASKESIEKMRAAKVGKKLTEEHKRKISESEKGKIVSKETREKLRIANTGKKHTEETKRKLSKIVTGRKVSEETKKKKSMMNSGKGNPFYGRKHTEDAKRKVSEKHSKTVVCLETGEIFVSAKSASAFLGLSKTSVSEACRGKTKTAGGFHWKYLEDAENEN